MAQTPNPAAAVPAGAAAPASAAASAAAAPASTSQNPGSHAGASNKDLPRDARVIGLILASLGVSDAEPGVVAQLLEFAHRYTLDILTSASTYAEHASRPRDAAAAGGAAAGPQSTTSSGAPLDLDDLRLAVSSKLEHSYSSPLPKEFLLPLAATLNRVPLPIIPDSYGIRLPHERERLTAVNWDLKPVKERREYPDIAAEEDSDVKAAHASTSRLGASTAAGDMDVELEGRDDLFGGADEEEEEDDDNDDDDDGDEDDDDDDDDDDEMEDVLGADAQPQPAGGQAQPGQQDEDAAGEDDDGEDAEGEEAASGEDARGEDDEYDA